jgi:serine/threonine protein kinase
MHALVGSKLGRYRLQRLLGHGGMSEVYLAYDERMHRDVAIKVLSSSQVDYIERFQREAGAIGNLHHDHILPAFDYGTQEPWHYLVMPYIEHESLSERLERGPLTLEEAGEILSQIADGLQFAHEHGIVHRDIKPSNILLRDDHYAYLADFGLAKAMDGADRVTRTGVLLGTPEYMAPELADGSASKSSDLYALGITLYEMVTGRLPFTGDTSLAVYLRQLHEPPIPPSRLNPAIPHKVEQVILRALDKDPRRRFQTPRELAQAYLQAVHATEEKLVLSEYPLNANGSAASSSGQTIVQPYARPAILSSMQQFARPIRIRNAGDNRNIFVVTGFMGMSFLLIIMSVILFAVFTYSRSSYAGNASTATAQAAKTGQTSRTNGTETKGTATPKAGATRLTSEQAEAATASAITSGTPLLSDDLSSSIISDWYVDNNSCIFTGGTYHVMVKQADSFTMCESNVLSYDNAVLQVDVSLLSGSNAGLIFRANDQQFYYFGINKQEEFFFGHHDPSSDGGTFTYLVQDRGSRAIAPGKQKNTLLVIAHDSDFKLFINGVFVGEQQDSTYTGGEVGFAAGTVLSVNSGEASFANFKVFQVS